MCLRMTPGSCSANTRGISNGVLMLTNVDINFYAPVKCCNNQRLRSNE